MDQPQRLDPLELPLELKPRNTETINGQPLPRGTVDEFARAIFSKPLAEIQPWPQSPGGLILATEKFVTAASKFYRLVWTGRGKTWLAAEDSKPYSTRKRVVAAGYELAAATGAFFDEGW